VGPPRDEIQGKPFGGRGEKRRNSTMMSKKMREKGGGNGRIFGRACGKFTAGKTRAPCHEGETQAIPLHSVHGRSEPRLRKGGGGTERKRERAGGRGRKGQLSI